MSTQSFTLRKPVIVANKKAMTDSLFTPINGRTADGYIIRRGKKTCDVWLNGKEYRVTIHRVWAVGTKQPDGKTWWQHAHIPEFSFSGLSEAADDLFHS